MPPPPPPPHLDIAPIIGPLFVGSILNWMFMGVLIMQYYTYYQTFPTDRLSLRLLVNLLFILDAVQTVTSTMFSWFFIITTWGNPADFSHVPWTAAMIPILCGVVTAIVQIFYAWRIWILAPSRFFKFVAVLVVALAITQVTASLVAGGMVFHNTSQAELAKVRPEDQVHEWRLPLWLATSLCVDIIITSAMSWILTRAKQQSHWRPTETVLTALIHRAVQTGAVSVICAAIDLAMFLGYPTTNFHLAPAYVLGKVYSNSLMLTLNLRRPTAPSWDLSGAASGLSFRMGESRRGDTTVDVDTPTAAMWNPKRTHEYMPSRSGLSVGGVSGEEPV